MTLRVTTSREGPTTTVKVDGKLLRPGVVELETVCQSLEGEFALDLSDLLHADDAGIDALRNLVDSGVPLLAVSPYIELLLSDDDR